MMGKVIILSDIHGNLSALQAVMEEVKRESAICGVALLGDLIDYGMRSNEVVASVKAIPYPFLCNIWGNHERAVITGNYGGFSSERGAICARYTGSILTQNTRDYIMRCMTHSGMFEFELGKKKCLAVHGSMEDFFWKSIRLGEDLSVYRDYDYVFSGHSHLPHFFEQFYEADDPRHRNKKKTVFINPGSVGQPRNHNPMAQFAVLDIENGQVEMRKAAYDIKREQKFYNGQVDDFYRSRLEYGV